MSTGKVLPKDVFGFPGLRINEARDVRLQFLEHAAVNPHEAPCATGDFAQGASIEGEWRGILSERNNREFKARLLFGIQAEYQRLIVLQQKREVFTGENNIRVNHDHFIGIDSIVHLLHAASYRHEGDRLHAQWHASWIPWQ